MIKLFKILGLFFILISLNNCADVAIGALQGLEESGRADARSKQAWGELGYDQKEFEDISLRFENFEKCTEAIRSNNNYKFLKMRSPKVKSYEHYADKSYVNQAERMSISWVGKETDKCSVILRDAKYNSPMAQEFILIPQRLLIQQLFLLASLDNKEINWGEYNRKTEELDNFAEKKVSDFLEKMKNQSYQVKNRIMILNEIDTLNANRAYLDTQLQRSKNQLKSLRNENRKLENEKRRIEMCVRNPGEYLYC
ncbi:hypothetical protein [Candidatus Pelagibacter sp. HIMB1746]|uniref:hypothetical protein n=1 Tax=Candidatus Pelagibacter sp. HIMB1746 TaxID=3413370 RepID=UPI003F8443D8